MANTTKTGPDVERAGWDARASAALHLVQAQDQARIVAILASFGIAVGTPGSRRYALSPIEHDAGLALVRAAIDRLAGIWSVIDRDAWGDRADARTLAVNVDEGDRAQLVAVGLALAAAGDPVTGGFSRTRGA